MAVLFSIQICWNKVIKFRFSSDKLLSPFFFFVIEYNNNTLESKREKCFMVDSLFTNSKKLMIGCVQIAKLENAENLSRIFERKAINSIFYLIRMKM